MPRARKGSRKVTSIRKEDIIESRCVLRLMSKTMFLTQLRPLRQREVCPWARLCLNWRGEALRHERR